MHSRAFKRGFSLVELMVAMTLGVFLVGGCLSIFTGVVKSSALNQTVSTLQSNSRFALESIGRDIRAAGFIGCSSERDIGLNVTVANPPTSNLTATAITGYVVGASNWRPEYPTGYVPPAGVGAPVAGTHALSVQYAQYPGFALDASMISDSSPVVLRRIDETSLQVGQLMVLSDCGSADLFSIASVSSAGNTITVSSDETLAKPYAINAGFAPSTRGMLFVSTIYYIGNTQRKSAAGDEVYSLYAHSYPYTVDNRPVEIVEGADQLALEFGVRQADGSLLYVIAGADGYLQQGVETVRVGLMLSSLERFSTVDDSRSYVLAGQRVVPSAAGASSAANELSYIRDKRMRMPFNATFNVRNRNL